MLTLSLLSVTALLKVVFAGVAVGVVTHIRPAHAPPKASWVWLTAAFVVSASSGLFQAVWAVLAFGAGPGAGAYELYLVWMPAMNYSRFGIMIALGFALTALPFLRVPASLRTLFWPILIAVACLLPGLAAGYAEGPFNPALHHGRLSVLQVVETFALLGALFVAAVRQSMDTWLWLAFFVYGFRQAVNSLLWAGITWEAVPDAWHPPFWLDPAIGSVVWLTMIGLAGYRLKLARRGASPPAIFAIPGDGPNFPTTTGIDLSRR